MLIIKLLSKISYQFHFFLLFEYIFGIGNGIGSEGMKYLSESLKSNNSIQTLNLRCK